MHAMPGLGPWTCLQKYVLLNRKSETVDTGPLVKSEHGRAFGAIAEEEKN